MNASISMRTVLRNTRSAVFGPRRTPQLGAEQPDDDEHEIAARLIESIKAVSRQRHPHGTMQRFNQAKGVACLEADFHVPDNLPSGLRQGLFAQPGHYRARLRFANASKNDDREKDFRGLSIKVFDVDGESLWGTSGLQDFVLNSYPALFAGRPEKFLDFVEATRDGAVWKFFANPLNWDSLWIVLRGRRRITSPFEIAYWSTTPYRFGTDESVAVKYSVRPCSQTTSRTPANPGADYLSEAVADHLEREPACFDFMVQFQSDPESMPIEDASVVWDEAASPFQSVARITVQNQSFQTGEALADCERMSFNPWQSLAAHRPLGGINRVRRAVYAELADFRQEHSREQ